MTRGWSFAGRWSDAPWPTMKPELTIRRLDQLLLDRQKLRHPLINGAAIATNLLDQARKSENSQLWGEMAAIIAHDSAMFRSSGCVVLDIARVASGSLDAAVIFRPEAADLDLGVTLAMESGALSGDFSGNPSTSNARQLVVANPRLFREVLKTLHPFRGRLPR